MRENRPYGSEGGEQRYCSPTPIGEDVVRHARYAWGSGLRRSDEGGYQFCPDSSGRRPGSKHKSAVREAWIPASAGTTRYLSFAGATKGHMFFL